jgi:ABC-type nitrate/sulfonate/bicarbonate transport system substrate-binding protein
MRVPKKAGGVIIAVVAAALCLAACGSSGTSSTSSGGAVKARILSYPTSGSSWVEYIALKQGFFTNNGIDATLISLPAGQQGTAALAGGSLDVGLLDTNNVGPLLAKGGQFTLLTNAIQNYWILIGNKGLAGKDLGDAVTALKGKAVAVPSLGGSGGRQMQVIQSAYGVSNKDVTLTADPSSASFTSGRVGAYMTDTLDSCAVLDQGYPKVMDFVDPPNDKSSYPQAVQNLIGLAGLGFWATGDWVKANPGVATKFQTAINQTIAWAKNPANLGTIQSLFRKTTWDFPSLTDDQWKTCAQRVVNTFSARYTTQDATTWNSILKLQNVGPLPDTGQWLAAGIPQT